MAADGQIFCSWSPHESLRTGRQSQSGGGRGRGQGGQDVPSPFEHPSSPPSVCPPSRLCLCYHLLLPLLYLLFHLFIPSSSSPTFSFPLPPPPPLFLHFLLLLLIPFSSPAHLILLLLFFFLHLLIFPPCPSFPSSIFSASNPNSYSISCSCPCSSFSSFGSYSNLLPLLPFPPPPPYSSLPLPPTPPTSFASFSCSSLNIHLLILSSSSSTTSFEPGVPFRSECHPCPDVPCGGVDSSSGLRAVSGHMLMFSYSRKLAVGSRKKRLKLKLRLLALSGEEAKRPLLSRRCSPPVLQSASSYRSITSFYIDPPPVFPIPGSH